MKKIFKRFSDIFSPKALQGLDSHELLAAFNDPVVRKEWLWSVYEELKALNLKIDASLTSGADVSLFDLSARRKAYQDILEAILAAKRLAHSHNPADKSGFDLDAVTAGPA